MRLQSRSFHRHVMKLLAPDRLSTTKPNKELQMSGKAKNNGKTAIVSVQNPLAGEQAATASVLEDMQKASLETRQPEPRVALFSWEIDPPELAKLISEVVTLPMVLWSTGISLTYSLWLSSLLPARETIGSIKQSADYG
ncbi:MULTISPECIES: hypothetical protein [unclassified Rhizobium]|uniref:hypothetical protein n=1 Tax=unclassified Rhizobium TaxID=2613769 RepID=UPI00287F9515|nr:MULTISPECIES: hypothetical protein [unclassified Rhizobium]